MLPHNNACRAAFLQSLAVRFFIQARALGVLHAYSETAAGLLQHDKPQAGLRDERRSFVSQPERSIRVEVGTDGVFIEQQAQEARQSAGATLQERESIRWPASTAQRGARQTIAESQTTHSPAATKASPDYVVRSTSQRQEFATERTGSTGFFAKAVSQVGRHEFLLSQRYASAFPTHRVEKGSHRLSYEQLLGLCLILLIMAVVASVMLMRAKSSADPVQEEQLEAFPIGTMKSPLKIFGLTCPSFVYGFMAATLTLMVFPMEAEFLFPGAESFALGGIFMIVAVSMLLQPIAGQFSDRLRHPLGRRKPVFIVSAQLACLGTALMWHCSEQQMKYPFFIALFLQQIMYNVCSAIQTSVLADIVDPQYVAFATNVQVGNAITGALTGIFVSQKLAKNGVDYLWNYASLIFLSQFTLLLHLCACPETPSTKLRLPEQFDISRPIQAAISVYDISFLAVNPNFRLIMHNRYFYYAGLSCKVYLLYFVRDVFEISDVADQSAVVARMICFAEGIAGIVSLFTSVLLERGVMTPKPLAIVGAILMGLSLQFELVAFVHEQNIKQLLLLSLAAGYGVGQCVYLTGDLALAVITVPNLEEASQQLALSQGISACIGGAVGSAIASILCEIFGKVIPEKQGRNIAPGSYALEGYTAILVFGMVCNFCCAAITTFVDATPRRQASATEPSVKDTIDAAPLATTT